MKEEKIEKTEETTIDVDSLSEEQAKEMLKGLIEENSKIMEELEASKKESADFKDKWMRNVAEFDNYKKRNAKLWQDAFNDGKADVLLKVLSVGDNLDRALLMDLDEKTKEGVALILRQFNEMLKEQGVEEINPVGEVFDPMLCEAVMQAEKSDGEESGVVKTVFQKGYKLKDKVIRYAKVSVTN